MKDEKKNASERNASQSSDKLLTILECIAKEHAPVRLQDLAEKSGMTQSTVQRYLRTLQNADYVYQDEDTSRYGLTWKICSLTENMNTFLGLRNIANPFVNHLANTLQMGVCLVVERDGNCVYLDCVDYPQPHYTPLQYIGKQAPLHSTGSGKVLLSAFTASQINEYMNVSGLKKFTEYTITDPAKLLEEIEAVRRQGFAVDDQECEIGLKCISYPIRSYSGTIYAAISVFGNVDDMQEKFVNERIKPELQNAAKVISSRLGWKETE